jgi:hypothetical protein
MIWSSKEWYKLIIISIRMFYHFSRNYEQKIRFHKYILFKKVEYPLAPFRHILLDIQITHLFTAKFGPWYLLFANRMYELQPVTLEEVPGLPSSQDTAEPTSFNIPKDTLTNEEFANATFPLSCGLIRMSRLIIRNWSPSF